jgi:hypothetical protein
MRIGLHFGQEGYGYVGPFGLGNMTFADDVIDLPMVITTLSLGVKIGIGTSGICEDCAIGAEGIGLLWRFWDSRWRWGIGFGFGLRVGVVWRGVCDLWY